MKYKIKPNFKDRISKDRFTLGLVSGLIATISMSLLNYIFILITPAKNLFSDFVGIMLFGSKPNSLDQIIIALVAHVFLGGILGIVFAYLLLLITEKNLIIKGITFGTLAFLFMFSLGVIFKITGLEHSLTPTVLTKGIGSAFYGFVLAYSMLLLRDNN
ncbi:MAG: hypothetical protein JM58_09250 [Peptococcaceae bacterium BICA1-8]|nr:MAG: hypothetical protein JM58_09250 [Peptococcaceae bacterium BICA1-8]